MLALLVPSIRMKHKRYGRTADKIIVTYCRRTRQSCMYKLRLSSGSSPSMPKYVFTFCKSWPRTPCSYNCPYVQPPSSTSSDRGQSPVGVLSFLTFNIPLLVSGVPSLPRCSVRYPCGGRFWLDPRQPKTVSSFSLVY